MNCGICGKQLTTIDDITFSSFDTYHKLCWGKKEYIEDKVNEALNWKVNEEAVDILSELYS
jgi:hypothetical protein